MTESLSSESSVPYLWTQESIQSLPEFGSETGWFYGLVAVGEGDESRIELAEIFPGMGWATVDPLDSQTWPMILDDLANYSPEAVTR